MGKPIVYGPSFSTYVRSVRLALAEKGVEYGLVEVDILKGAHAQPEHLARHPFGKVPVLEHDGVYLYETGAILRYVEEAFDGPSLLPGTPSVRARINTVLSVVDHYGYQPCIHGLFIPIVLVPSLGGQVDAAKVEASKAPARAFVAELERLLGTANYFGGDQVTLADLHALPVLTYLGATSEGREILDAAPGLQGWMSRMGERRSVIAVLSPT